MAVLCGPVDREPLEDVVGHVTHQIVDDLADRLGPVRGLLLDRPALLPLEERKGAFRKRRSLGAGFLCSQLLDDNRRFPTHLRQGERPWRSTNPGGGPNQRKSLSNRAIGARRSGPRFETSNSRSKPDAATHP